MISYILALVTGVLVLGVDQYTKYYIMNNYTVYEGNKFIKGFIDIVYIHNDGGAWGIPLLLPSSPCCFFWLKCLIKLIFLFYLLPTLPRQSRRPSYRSLSDCEYSHKKRYMQFYGAKFRNSPCFYSQ